MSEREERETRSGRSPSDTESLVGDTAASEPLTGRPRVQPDESASRSPSRDAAHPTPGAATDGAADEAAELGHS